jgi:DNA polymerase-1
MRHLTVTLGGTPVRIDCPAPGEVDVFDGPEEYGLPSGTLYGLDVESTALGDAGAFAPDFRVRTVQFAPADDRAIVLRLDDPDQREVARVVLADPTNEFVSHTKIDVHAVRAALGVDIAGRYLDTHVLAVMAAPDDRAGQASLKPVADRFGMPELGRGEEALKEVFDRLYRAEHPEIGRRAVKGTTLAAWGFTNVSPDDETFLTYAGLDALAVRRLVPLLTAQTRAPLHVLRNERALSASAVRLERRGHLVDVERLEQISGDARLIEERAAGVVAEHTGGLRTTQGVKLQAWLADHGVDWDAWPNTMRTEKGAPSLAKENVTKLRTFELDGPGRAVVEAMIEHAGVIDKLKRTAEVRSAMDGHGRTHGTLYTVGTVTSRMSSSGPNMQNFSKKDPTMRGMFVFDPGRIGLSCDFAQIELRVLAALAREQAMIDTIMAGGDLHQLTADLLGITRQQAKTVNFLIVYGGGGPRLASQLKHTISDSEGRAIVKRYWQQYPAIAGLNSFMKNQRDVRLISGRYVPVGDRSHAAMNYLIQGSARELLAGAWNRFEVEAAARGLDARIWFPIHDELVIDAAEDDAQDVAALIGECMTFPMYSVPVKADADLLIDEEGVSRWMTGDEAKRISELKLAS